jgi:hypothetical protein
MEGDRKACGDKSWPIILLGDKRLVWIVEGGGDGLAVQSLYARKKALRPTVIVTGGVKVLSRLANTATAAPRKAAGNVRMAREPERSETAQAEADKAHAAQRRAVENAGVTPKIWTPPDGALEIGEPRSTVQIARQSV